MPNRERLRRRPPRTLRIFRGATALVLLGLVELTGVESLRAFGFRFRWETQSSMDGWGPPGHILLVRDLSIDP